jgi:hypothetical protein
MYLMIASFITLFYLVVLGIWMLMRLGYLFVLYVQGHEFTGCWGWDADHGQLVPPLDRLNPLAMPEQGISHITTLILGFMTGCIIVITTPTAPFTLIAIIAMSIGTVARKRNIRLNRIQSTLQG